MIALAGGAAVFGSIGRGEYQIAWFALVVGVHFLVFGRLFATRFYLLGAALVGAAVAGTAIGLAGGSAGLVEAVTGFASAVSLFVPPILTIRQFRAQQRGHAARRVLTPSFRRIRFGWPQATVSADVPRSQRR